MRRRVRECLVAVALLFSATFGLAQSPIRYVYDELGRLVGVIDANGDAALYSYDAVGNLLAISRLPATQVSIIEFTPDGGTIGQTVTIYGTGFSATAGQNTVSFNGTAAAVVSATTGTIVTAVPSGATTGAICVSSPSGSASSSTSFVVGASSAPTIVSFTPTIGTPSTAVTVSGTNFDPVPAQNRLSINQTRTDATVAVATELATSVPLRVASGRITVKTQNGTAVSVDDFIIPPSPYGAGDVETAARIPVATASTVTLPTANRIGLRLFDGAAGGRVSLLGTNGLTGQIFGCDVLVSILNPFATALGSATCMEGWGFIDASTLPDAGTYSILVDPAATATGSVTLTLYDVPADFTSNITASGSSVTATMSTPGQNGSLTFSGTTGQRVSLVGTNGMTGQVSLLCDVNASIVTSAGAVVASPTCMEGSGFIDVLTLPSTSTYRIVVDPYSYATGSLTLALHDVPADFNSTIVAGGSPVTATMGTPGQNGAMTFSGTAGQRISLNGTNGLSSQVLGCDVNVSILKPDATVLATPTCMEGSGFIDVLTLPATGTYTIAVDPISHAVGNLTLTLYDVPADPADTIAIGGSAVPVTLGTPGQNGTLTFSGTAGQQVTVRVPSNTVGWTWVRLLKPDGSELASGHSPWDFNLPTQTLPTTGTYTIVIDPDGARTGSVSIQITNP